MRPDGARLGDRARVRGRDLVEADLAYAVEPIAYSDADLERLAYAELVADAFAGGWIGAVLAAGDPDPAAAYAAAAAAYAETDRETDSDADAAADAETDSETDGRPDADAGADADV